MNDKELREKILELTAEWSRRNHSGLRPGYDSKKSEFIPGETPIPYAARTFTELEVVAAINTTLDFWLTLGKEGAAFERELAQFLGIRKSLLVNSGSSANLIALSTLTSPIIEKERRLNPGDEVITCAAGFPTTISPIIQNGCIPVFLDNEPETGNINPELLEEAYVEGKTKAIMIAHTLGNPFDIGAIYDFCKRKNITLIEDNCDALGSTYTMPNSKAHQLGFYNSSPNIKNHYGSGSITKWTGTWGDLSTQSFYPPHHLTMGEGGAVNISGSTKLVRPAESFRDWGRDCWCESGKDNTCGKRFDWKLGELPEGYDHKYIYSHLGYNLKPLDVQAAIGRIQLKRLKPFIDARKKNWNMLREGLNDLQEFFDFSLPTHAIKWTSNGFEWDSSGCKSDCSWFGFMIRLRESSPISSSELARRLDQKKIGTRMLFGGNVTRQPALIQLKKDRKNAFRIVGSLKGADELMNRTVFLGVYPGLNRNMIDYQIENLHSIFNKI